MKSFLATTAATILVLVWGIAVAVDQQTPSCFYLDKQKITKELAPLTLQSGVDFLYLESRGLFQSSKLACQWSLNGGSGTKEQFSLDGDFAIPILNPVCEAPFSHKTTGLGFGDWYLTLCGNTSGYDLVVETNGTKYSVLLDSLKQWTEFEPGKFPIKGDHGD